MAGPIKRPHRFTFQQKARSILNEMVANPYGSIVVASIIIVLALNGIYASPIFVSELLCANETSYCLSGLDIKQINNMICTQYTYVGIVNNCSYFQSIHGLYLFWNREYESWNIYVNLEDNKRAAYCKKPLLDDCVSNATWMYFNGTIFYPHPTLGIEPCNDNNEQCHDSYNNDISYCIHNTEHRETNVGLRGKYWFEGCHMDEPYFVYSYTDNITFSDYTSGLHHSVINYTLHWNGIFLAWMISNKLTSCRFAFCEKVDIDRCKGNWEIYDGENYFKDKNVYSGKCDS